MHDWSIPLRSRLSRQPPNSPWENANLECITSSKGTYGPEPLRNHSSNYISAVGHFRILILRIPAAIMTRSTNTATKSRVTGMRGNGSLVHTETLPARLPQVRVSSGCGGERRSRRAFTAWPLQPNRAIIGCELPSKIDK